ncbi:uncharacterized protein LOC117910395 isoform X1 [Vitis riparia]|uniref:uncharacterized protein LOC117910395 isoform X1 n=1 Tax=Vitis riparia TaxID=96939 RepID=UPI00155A3938|nr:uncharacterized protein LOC117910395 isoform X1 [Vitis riparia]XP_034680360.1 uncharacterized protein LOC117910395 isoform X1 [Vitis riparia]
MRAEKQGSKSGGYVGGFFQLFDWNAKSRKKLFSNKSDLPERSKQGKKSDGNLPMTRFRLVTDDDEAGATPSFKGSSDYSCGSSVTDEEGYGTRAPGVVARLMGLDSLPPSNISEPYSSPFFDSQSLRDVHYNRKNFDFHHDHQIMHSGNLLNRVDGPSRSAMDLKPPKTLSRPIEKFQTEILPPKSAKSIPSTHHKLLSPIKSPGFIPTKNAAHIMEAAAKIIEPGPQATTKAKMPLVGSPLVPLKVRDLKERMEAAQKMPLVGSSSVPSKVKNLKEKADAAQKLSRRAETSRRPVESSAAKYLKGQSLNKSWNGSEETTSFRGSSDTEESSAGLKNKGKSISLAIQAKVNVQRREGLNPSTNRSSVGLREQNEVKSSQPFKSQSNTQKGVHKKPSTPNAPGVLRQNNQKQNCMVDKDKLPSKSFVSTSQSRKPLSGESSLGRHKTSSKVSGNSKAGSRKLGLEPTDSEKEVSYSSTKNFPRKKRSINGDFNLENNWVADNFLIDKNEKAFQSNTVKERHFSWAEDSRKKGMDVVSFTFTAPLTRSIPGSESPSQAAMNSNGLSTDYRGKKVLLEPDAKNLSSLGINVIGGDALSMLLDQKLRELTYGVDSSRRESFKVGSTASSSILQDLAPTLNALSTTHRLHDKRDQPWLQKDKMDSLYDSDFSFTAPSAFDIKHKLQGENEMDECSSSSNAEARNLLDCRHPSPVSILEPSFSTESCNSSDSTDSNSIEGSKHFSSVLAQELISLSFSKKFNSMEADAELSDSASSTSTATVATKHVVALTATCLVRSTKWELEYVKEILCNIELMFKDFALGRAREIINPHLFHQLENRKGGLEIDGDESRLNRKVLFDCVSECLDLRCRRYVGGGCKTWAKGVTMVRRKEWLSEEVYKEISGWRSMGDCMVDELVDKDMSSQYGRWLDFEVETFELGVEIESLLFTSLVDEIVADILLF